MKVVYIRTMQVKVSKVHVLVSQYEMFRMKERDSIEDFIQKFTIIANYLLLLGRTFDNADLMHKNFRSLIKEWQPKITTIKESLKMEMPIIQELYENLEEHELELKRYKKIGDEKKKRPLAPKYQTHLMMKMIKLDEIDTKDEEDEMALLCKKLQKNLKDKKNKEKRKTLPQKKTLNGNKQGGSSNTSTTLNIQPTYFKCKKPIHFKSDGPIHVKKLLENEKR